MHPFDSYMSKWPLDHQRNPISRRKWSPYFTSYWCCFCRTKSLNALGITLYFKGILVSEVVRLGWSSRTQEGSEVTKTPKQLWRFGPRLPTLMYIVERIEWMCRRSSRSSGQWVGQRTGSKPPNTSDKGRRQRSAQCPKHTKEKDSIPYP